MKILAHTSFIGTTGYANHARSFFTALNKYHTVKVRNLTIGSGWKGYRLNAHDDEPYITEEMKNMLYQQTLINTDNTTTDFPLYNYDGNYIPDIHIVYIDPLHHLQVELIRRYREGKADERVQRGIHISINGIAAGLRNTG